MVDNVIRRHQKASWGFTADENGQVTLGVPTDPNSKKSEDILQPDDNSEARGNGGGFPAEDQVTYEYLQSLTKGKLLELAAAHDITLDKPKGSKDEILAELVEVYEVAPAE